MSAVSRNAPCPCGSGRKHKHCCLEGEQRALREARSDTAVGLRIQRWAAEEFRGEMRAALPVFFGERRAANDEDLALLALWFHNDREVAGGGTPAERYAARPELDAAERETAGRIAAARLGLFRIVAATPGRSLTLEPLVGGDPFDATSPHMSREAVRWDVVLTHVMPGDPPSLWGPTRFFEPSEEQELLDELERLADAPLAGLGPAKLDALCRRHALELFRFDPPSSAAELTTWTLEGDPVAFGTAVFRVKDVVAAEQRLRELGGLLPGEPIELACTASRDALVAERRPLPRGAVVVDATVPGELDRVSIATVRLDGDELSVEAISEERLEDAVDDLEADLGDLVELVSVEVKTVEEALAERRDTGQETGPEIPASVARALADRFLDDHMRRWLDEPNQMLDGLTPRQAVAGPAREQLLRLLRQVENSAERARRDGEPAVDIAMLHDELGLTDRLAA